MNEDIWLDPSMDEAYISRGLLILACMPALDEVTNLWQTGRMSAQEAIKVFYVLFTNLFVLNFLL